jgi:hypothetical protein
LLYSESRSSSRPECCNTDYSQERRYAHASEDLCGPKRVRTPETYLHSFGVGLPALVLKSACLKYALAELSGGPTLTAPDFTTGAPLRCREKTASYATEVPSKPRPGCFFAVPFG